MPSVSQRAVGVTLTEHSQKGSKTLNSVLANASYAAAIGLIGNKCIDVFIGHFMYTTFIDYMILLDDIR